MGFKRHFPLAVLKALGLPDFPFGWKLHKHLKCPDMRHENRFRHRNWLTRVNIVAVNHRVEAFWACCRAITSEDLPARARATAVVP